MEQPSPVCLPPFLLNQQMSPESKEREKMSSLLLIAPVWPLCWYPLMLEMLRGIPHLLPQSWDILLNPQGEPHPLVIQGHLRLAA